MNRPYVICHILSSLDGKMLIFMERSPWFVTVRYRVRIGVPSKMVCTCTVTGSSPLSKVTIP